MIGQVLLMPRGASFHNVLSNLGLTTNLKLCLDAGDPSSYAGSGQKWLDTSGNGYDFFLGADVNAAADDPTFNGVAGNRSSSEYWTGASDLFTYDATNEAWMGNLHKDGAMYSIISFFYHPLNITGGMTFFRTGNANVPDIGMKFVQSVSGGGDFNLTVSKNDTPFALSPSAPADAPVEDSWNMAGVSVDEPTGAGGGFFYLNGSYNQVSASDTFNATYNTPSSSAATETANIFRAANSGNRMACLAVWEGAAISKANMDSIWTLMRGRFGL